MRWQELKLPVIIISMLAGLALIFGTQILYNKYTWEEPLKKYLDGNILITSHRLENSGGRLFIYVEVDPQANLAEAYKEINREVGHILGKREFDIFLLDNRDEFLKDLWYSCQYAVYQAQQQGTYQDMAKTVSQEAAFRGVEAKIYVDGDYIYLRLKNGERTLDEVIPRFASINPTAVQMRPHGGGVNVQRG